MAQSLCNIDGWLNKTSCVLFKETLPTSWLLAGLQKAALESLNSRKEMVPDNRMIYFRSNIRLHAPGRDYLSPGPTYPPKKECTELPRMYRLPRQLISVCYAATCIRQCKYCPYHLRACFSEQENNVQFTITESCC